MCPYKKIAPQMTEDIIPSEFICPLTLQLFENPLLSRHGMNYERSAIVEWLDLGNDTCPLTRQPLKLSGLIHNKHLKNKIELWKQENGWEEEQDQQCLIQRSGLMADEMLHEDSVTCFVPTVDSATTSTTTTATNNTTTNNNNAIANRAANNATACSRRKGRKWLRSLVGRKQRAGQ
ncbi:Putative E3 ubiquitin-protein ligase LIN [Seminavis robusta]|uniref:E3 ubiquitin-protein ligase LIN n=1 Tax=Seminavis robusta TaxID=568900 RepID=A0A9N8H6S2_9STRA|nr:Putative E3 ubiquitin-protein ligase LIN [Seminavis robusta]|eukprot:Sro179_g078560.1 Putative E3 ubiquitin-protein ligase LIN (177) ;mRNA; r:65995-66525